MFEEVERQAEVNAEKNTKEAAKAAKRERNLVRVARIEEAAKQNPEEKAKNTLKVGRMLASAGNIEAAKRQYRIVVERLDRSRSRREHAHLAAQRFQRRSVGAPARG